MIYSQSQDVHTWKLLKRCSKSNAVPAFNAPSPYMLLRLYSSKEAKETLKFTLSLLSLSLSFSCTHAHTHNTRMHLHTHTVSHLFTQLTDIDECASDMDGSALCQYQCTNTEGGYNCSCPQWYVKDGPHNCTGQ